MIVREVSHHNEPMTKWELKQVFSGIRVKELRLILRGMRLDTPRLADNADMRELASLSLKWRGAEVG